MKIIRIKLSRLFLAAATVAVLSEPLACLALVGKGEPAPPFRVTSTSGQQITLANYKGYVLIIDFFATWCPPCREAIQHLNDLYRKYNKQGLEVLGLSADEGGDKVLKPFAEKRIRYPAALAGESVLDDFAIRSLPTLFVINKKGLVVERFQGSNDQIDRSMELLVKKLLAE